MSATPATHPTSGKLAGVTVGDAMHHGIVGCSPAASLTDAARLMADSHVHCLIVHGVASGPRGDEKLVWGVLTDHDLLRAARAQAAVDLSAGDLANPEVVTVDPGEALDDAVALMLELHTTHLVVVSPEDQRPVGILSSLDVAASLATRG
jgi:CBS domain-containing protein